MEGFLISFVDDLKKDPKKGIRFKKLSKFIIILARQNK